MLSGNQVERQLVSTIDEALAASPVVAITGPRISGRSTLARGLVDQRGATLIDLDDSSVRALAQDDPQAFVRGLDEPIVLDEFQRVPDLLGAIKAELDVDRRPGRFMLTGSARHEVVPELAAFLTGRIELLTLWPFAVAEVQPGIRSIVDRLFDGTLLDARRTSGIGRDELINLVITGGYPIATTLANRSDGRRFWRTSSGWPPDGLLSCSMCRNSEGTPGSAATRLASTCACLNSYLTVVLPAWSVNLTSRISKRPKLHPVDSGLAAHLQGVTASRLSPVDPAATSRFGALLETFVVMEVIKQLGWAEQPAAAYHYRMPDGIEVDLVLEAADGRVAAIEVKAGSRVTQSSTAGLAHLRDRLGERFEAGIVLTTGSQTQRIGDRLAVAPVDSLWHSEAP